LHRKLPEKDVEKYGFFWRCVSETRQMEKLENSLKL